MIRYFLKGICGVGLLALLGATLIVGPVTASQTVEQSARETVSKVFDAAIKHDFDTFLDYTIDNNEGRTKEIRRQQLIKEKDLILDYKILSVMVIDDKNTIVTLSITQNPDGKIEKVTAQEPVTLIGDKWVVDVGNGRGSTDSIKNSYEREAS